MALKHEKRTRQIIKALYNVYNELGYGFLEEVYENALALGLESMGLRVGRQRPIKVYHLGRQVGDYYADLMVEGLVIIELKSAEALCEAHEAQLLNLSESNRHRGGPIAELWSAARVSPEDLHQR